jgi:hypothetical protein
MKKGNNSLLNTWHTTPIRKFSLKEALVTLIFLFLLFFFLPLEYDNIKAKNFLYPIILASIAFIAYKLLPEPSEMRTFIFSIGGGVYFLLIFFTIPRLIGFCASTDHGVSYVNKKDHSIRLIMRGYACFLTDDDAEFFKEHRITKHIKWVTSFNEQSIDTTKWEHAPFILQFDRE